VTTLLIYVLSTPQGAPPFWENRGRMGKSLRSAFVQHASHYRGTPECGQSECDEGRIRADERRRHLP
jgi:hypothetical protein